MASSLRDVVDTLVRLDDEQRAITNELNRALDGLERAASSRERSAALAAELRALRERLAFGSGESPILGSIAARLIDAIVSDARADAELMASPAPGDRRPPAERAAAVAQHLRERLEAAESAFEHLGRLKVLLAHRAAVDEELRVAKGGVDADEETEELLAVTLAARQLAAERASHDARQFLDDAFRIASEDGVLAGLAANIRALRDALRTGGDPASPGKDLARRVVDMTVKLKQEREDLRRKLARLARDTERRQEIAHGLFQATTKASDVLDQVRQLEASRAQGPLKDGALGPLKAACLEHGVISVLLAVRALRVDREILDEAVAELSSALGALLGKLSQHPDRVEVLARVWDEMAAVDARAVEQDWEASYAEVLGVRREGDGVLSVMPEMLERLSHGDTLDHWGGLLQARLGSKRRNVRALVSRLEEADAALEATTREGGTAGELAADARERLAVFIHEVVRATDAYFAAVRDTLVSPERGFPQVEHRISGFVRAEDLGAGTSPADRQAVFASILADVRSLFTMLETTPPLEGRDAETGASIGWKETEGRTRDETLGTQRTLAAILARTKRLRSLLFPEPAPACADAVALAQRFRGDTRRTPADLPEGPLLRDLLGESLEALHVEKLYLEHLELPLSSEIRVLASLARDRCRRLLELHGAALTLLFRLLVILADEYETLSEDDRPGYLSWMEELLLHAREETRRHVDRLEDCLFDLPDNAVRHAQLAVALDAYHGWAQHVADRAAGLELLSAHGRVVFEQFEREIGRLGTRLLDELSRGEADWRTSSALESLAELSDRLVRDAARRPTSTDLAGAWAGVGRRAREQKAALLAVADQARDPLQDAGRALFR